MESTALPSSLPLVVSASPHTHDWDETYLVLEELNLNINGQPTVVRTGDSYRVCQYSPRPHNGEFCRYV